MLAGLQPLYPRVVLPFCRARGSGGLAWLLSLALVVPAVPSALVTRASAAPAPAPSAGGNAEAEAKRHFDIGLKLYKEKLYEAALTEFEQSYEIVPRPSALRNVAQCHRDLKRMAEAYATYGKLLSVHAAQLSPKEKDAVQKAIKELENVTGTLTLTVSPDGATILVDGKKVGESPLASPVRLDVGPHTVKVQKDGFLTQESPVKVVAQQQGTFEAKLVAEVKTGTLTVREKSGAAVKVWVDDKEMGPAPWTGEVSPGSHTVELKGKKFASPKRTVEVALKGTVELVVEANALRGRLRVETLNKVGKIFVDDEEVGSGTWEGEVKPGSHEIRVEAEGFEPYKHLVAVEQGQTVIEPVTLVPKSAATGPTPASYIGLSGRFELLGGFSLSGAGQEISPAAGVPTDEHAPMGGGAGLHLGYSFGLLQAEIVGMFLLDYHQGKRTFSGGKPTDANFYADAAKKRAGDGFNRTEKYEYLGLAGYGGLGGRITSQDDAVRFTFGASFGFAYRSIDLKRTTYDDGWKPGAVSYLAPALVLDGGLLLGSTPGVRMTLGAMLWIDFPGSGGVYTADEPAGRNISATFGSTTYGAILDSPAQKVRSGTQIYVGPTLGLQFGR